MVVLLAIPFGTAAKTVELEVFRDWRGTNCTFKSSRPFFVISDIYDLEKFWEKADADEPMPSIDFGKYMLLVWNPGPSLFDHDPVRVDRFIYKDGSFIVLFDFKRKDSGGYWRRPFVATALPRVKKGDLFIMKKEEVGFRKVKWTHVYTLWDMSPNRTMPFEIVKIDEIVAKPQYIDQGNDPLRDQIYETREEPKAESQKIASTAKTAPDTASKPVSKKVSAAAKAAKKDADFFPDFGTPAAKTKEKKPAAVKAKKSAKLDEDPLFGEEFDINF